MRLVAATLVLLFLGTVASPQEPAPPVPLDWSLFPVIGDKDRAEKNRKIKELYSGKLVVVEGPVRAHGHSARTVTVEVIGPLFKRGELAFTPVVHARFQDVRPEPIHALTERKAVVRIEGRMNDSLVLDEARLVPLGKAKPKR